MDVDYDIAIILGSKSDEEHLEGATKILDENNIKYDVQYLSAHRDPEKLDLYLKESTAKLYIAMAGLSAALPGVIAARTDKPVIGVPLVAKNSPAGLDSLFSITQMPPRVPVACVGLNNSKNAAYLAIRILNLIKKEGE